MKRLLAVFVLGLACAALTAQGQSPPHGGCLEMCMAQLDGNELTLRSTVTHIVYEEVRVKKVVDGKEVEAREIRVVPRTTEQVRKVDLKKVEAFNGSGKPLGREVLTARLRNPAPVLASYGWTGDSPFKGQLREDAIVLRLPMPEYEKGHGLEKERDPAPRKELPQEK
jgi:hypothetical protein